MNLKSEKWSCNNDCNNITYAASLNPVKDEFCSSFIVYKNFLRKKQQRGHSSMNVFAGRQIHPICKSGISTAHKPALVQ